jgi:hypothetical protein
MMVADRLGKSISEVMEFSTLEINMWAAYLKLEQDHQKKTMKKTRK